MPYALRTFTCIDCGKWFLRRRPPGTEQRCIPCGVAYSAEVQRQLHEKSGPYYQRWKWAYAQAARRMMSSPAPGESLTKAS